LGFLLGIPAVLGLILGIIAKVRAGKSGKGSGLATAAIVISIIWIAVIVFLTMSRVGEPGPEGGNSPTVASASGNQTSSPTPSPDESATREQSPSPETEATTADSVGPSEQTIEVVCPFIFTFVNDHPESTRRGIALATLGQASTGANVDVMRVSRITEQLSLPDDGEFIGHWFNVADYLVSPEYMSGEVGPNESVASQSLVALYRECQRSVRDRAEDGRDGARALKQATKACKNWPLLYTGVTKDTYKNPKNVKQRERAYEAAKKAAALDTEWSRLRERLGTFNRNFEKRYESTEWSDADMKFLSASVDIDAECAKVSALSK